MSEPKRGLIIDGVIGSEAVDSSGEILDVSGCDISSLETDGILNYEHKGSDDANSSFNDVIGKCIKAKKIFSEDDCSTDREREYWKRVKLPFIYGQFRLFNESGHPGAIAAAAIMRDQDAAGEDQILRLSIEGSTIQKEGNILKVSMARAVALTKRPCNRTAITGVLSDNKRDKDEITGRTELSKSGSKAFIVVDDSTFATDVRANLQKLDKALSGGDYNAAPGTLTGGAALQVEDLHGVHRIHKAVLSAVKSAIRDWAGEGGKDKLGDLIKFYLPEASDEFIGHFTNLVDDWTVKKREAFLAKKEAAQPKEPKPTPEPAPADLKQKDGGTARDPKNPKRLEFQIAKEKDGSPRAILHTRKDSYILYNPGVHISQKYEEALHDPQVNAIHDHAMKNWVVLHRLARERKLPPQVIAHAALFSAMSPNTPVPIQELAYGFLMDMKSRGWDPTKALGEGQRAQWESEFQKFAKGHMLPQYMRDHFSRREAGVHIANDQTTKDSKGNLIIRDHWTGETPDEGEWKDDPKKAGARGDIGLAKQKAAGALNYADMHNLLVGLIQQHGVDGRAVAAHLNHLKHQDSLGNLGDDDPEVSGFAPKTIRYTLGMLGLGNVHVPDTHLIRHLFGLPLSDERSDKLKGVLWDAKNEPILAKIDDWYYRNHPAVQHTRNKLIQQYGEDFGEQSIFPGFWLHWLTIEPHERARNWNVKAKNANTDHSVFFNSIFNLLDEYGVPYRHHMKKSEGNPDETSLPARAAHVVKVLHDRFGYTPAMIAYYAYIVPALLGNTQMLNKAEKLKTRMLRKNEQAPANVKNFRGHYVIPGEVVHNSPSGPVKYPLLHVDSERHYIEHGMSWGVGERRAVANSVIGNGEWQVTRLPQKLRGNMQLDHAAHALPGLAEGDEQKALIHGMDLSNEGLGRPDDPDGAMHGEMSVFRKSGAGILGFVKPGGEVHNKEYGAENFTAAQREAAFYHLAKNAFGLGDYVPPTAAFRHPISGEHHSVMQALPGAEHFDGHPGHMSTLSRLGLSGELDKLALMDGIMGQSDRHSGNWMFDGVGDLKLIDNGYSFAAGPSGGGAYYHPTYHGKGVSYKTPLHPEAARWVKGLNPEALSAEARRIGVPEPHINEMLRRLKLAKGYAEGAATAETILRGMNLRSDF